MLTETEKKLLNACSERIANAPSERIATLHVFPSRFYRGCTVVQLKLNHKSVFWIVIPKHKAQRSVCIADHLVSICQHHRTPCFEVDNFFARI